MQLDWSEFHKRGPAAAKVLLP